MPNTNNMYKERILKAIEYIDVHGIPKRRHSIKYDLLYNGTLYPPKYVIDIANIYENEEELRDTNGKKIGMHSFLEDLGFKILYPNDEIDRDKYNRPFVSDKESFGKEENKRYIPELEPSKRSREYNHYSINHRDTIVYEYLFNSISHRKLDENILGIPADKRTGHESMNILHYIGLKDKHKGIFKNYAIEDVIINMEQQVSDYSLVIQSLQRYNNQINKIQGLEETINYDIDSDMAEEDSYYNEGAVKEYYGKRYERNPENRKKAIEIHGCSCIVCGFNFEQVYGERGRDFIEVHHVKPLSVIGKEVLINPKEDLVPVCANCHRMIHRRKGEVISINELKVLLNGKKQ